MNTTNAGSENFTRVNPKLQAWAKANINVWVTYADKAKFKRAEERKSDRLLAQAQQEMFKSQRMLDIAIKFVDRMKIAWAIDIESDEHEGEYINYIYNMLMEWQQIEKIEEKLSHKSTKNIVKEEIATENLRATDVLRLSLLTSLKHNDTEIELIEKAGRDTYYVDGSEETNIATGQVYSSRKIRCSTDPETWRNEVYEVGYVENNTDDLRDPVEKNELDLTKVVFSCKGVA